MSEEIADRLRKIRHDAIEYEGSREYILKRLEELEKDYVRLAKTEKRFLKDD